MVEEEGVKKKIDPRWFIIIFFFALAIVSLIGIINIVWGMPEPIGIITYDSDYLLAWNQNENMNQTFYNKTSGLIQVSNYLDRSGDITYTFGFARKVGSSYTFYGLDTLPGNVSYGTDWTTNYWASSQKNFSNFSQWFFIEKNNTQGLYDDMVYMTYKFVTSHGLIGNNYFLRQLKDIDVGEDGILDMYVIHLANGSDEQWWNDTGTNEWTGVMGIEIHGLIYSYHLRFDTPVIVFYNHTSKATNGDLAILDPLPIIVAGRTYTFTNYWIDVSCAVSCPSGCIYGITGNFTHVEVKQGTTLYNFEAWVYETGLTCASGGHCNIGIDCGIYPSANSSSPGKGNFTQIFQDWPDYPVKCADSTCMRRPLSLLTHVYFNVTASAIMKEYWKGCFGGGGTECTKTLGTFRWNTTGYTQNFNVTLEHPVANANTTNSSVYFRCGANVSADNVSLYFANGTSKNYTATMANVSTDVLFDNLSRVYWSCRACYSNLCNWNWGGNRSLIVWIPWFQTILWSEANNANLTRRPLSTGTWATMVGNTTGWCVDNSTYYLNDSVYGTKTGCANASYNVSITTYGIWTWGITSCKDGLCRPASNNNFTFFRQPEYDVSQWSPINNTVLVDENVTLAGVNTSGFTTPDNITLIVDGNTNYSSSPNLTYNLSIETTGQHTIGALTCIQGHCRLNQILYITYNQTLAPIVEEILEEDDEIIFFTIILLGVIAIFLFIRMKKNKPLTPVQGEKT